MSTNNLTTDGQLNLSSDTHGSLYKVIGVTLAVASGIFIGSSFVLKKKGLLQSTARSGGVAGEGYEYLKSTMWWSGMILMVVGEACNFVAYAFTQAILVTPLGALSVVLCAVLSSIFLKERLSFQGKVGCLQCVLGAVIIVLHAPEQGAADTSIETFRKLMISPGFILYAFLATAISLFLRYYCCPRWGKTNMLVYITICSLIGSLSVVFTQGIGGAIVHSFTIENQFNTWFVYLVLTLTLVTLAVEIVYLNKALNIFNTAVVTPTYYVIFTTLTIVSSIIFYRGFEASPVDIITCVFGFFIICSGVALLQNSRSEKRSQSIPLQETTRRMSQENLLNEYHNEKYNTSDEEVDYIEDIVNSGSCARSTAGRGSMLHNRSRSSIDDYRIVDLSNASSTTIDMQHNTNNSKHIGESTEEVEEYYHPNKIAQDASNPTRIKNTGSIRNQSDHPRLIQRSHDSL